jgi:hypothetical protein
MDDPTLGLSTSVNLRRICEHTRLEKQFLIDAYECLVAIIEDDRLRKCATDGPRSVDRNAKREVIHSRADCPGGPS